MPGTGGPENSPRVSPRGQQSIIDWKVFLINSGGAVTGGAPRLLRFVVVKVASEYTHTHTRTERALSRMLSSMTTNCYVGFGFGFTRAYTTAELAQTKILWSVWFALLQKRPLVLLLVYFSPSLIADIFHISYESIISAFVIWRCFFFLPKEMIILLIWSALFFNWTTFTFGVGSSMSSMREDPVL